MSDETAHDQSGDAGEMAIHRLAGGDGRTFFDIDEVVEICAPYRPVCHPRNLVDEETHERDENILSSDNDTNDDDAREHMTCNESQIFPLCSFQNE